MTKHRHRRFELQLNSIIPKLQSDESGKTLPHPRRLLTVIAFQTNSTRIATGQTFNESERTYNRSSERLETAARAHQWLAANREPIHCSVGDLDSWYVVQG